MDSLQLQGYLLSLCGQNMGRYIKACDLLVESLVVDSDCSRRVNEDAVLKLVGSLKPFEKKLILDRSVTHELCKKNSHLPDVIEHIFGKPGVDEKRPV